MPAVKGAVRLASDPPICRDAALPPMAATSPNYRFSASRPMAAFGLEGQTFGTGVFVLLHHHLMNCFHTTISHICDLGSVLFERRDKFCVL